MAISPRTDEEIQEDVLNELRWEPRVRANEIGVITRDGVVTLLGWVDSYVQKVAAEAAARRVRGVRDVINEIEVRLAGSAQRTDDSLAKSVKDTLAWHVPVPIDDLDVRVSNGWVTLKGEVEYNFQKREAEHVVQRIPGVKGITNLITVKPNPVPGDLKLKIEEALVRNAETDAKHIKVEVKGSKVILRGKVHSNMEKLVAEESAWSAPGVTEVENQIEVDPALEPITG
ncbi:BON domain-containing protein [Ktedonobacter racemifer]|jgi:osmotically-inducible protein OsmY|uniref:Transport-associated protein n=1 Tax=Ktedonobacter racemifer DSM 44963 TaxID=485913 RepID=D6U7D7_KTERA|nr:BON domain-containing protein [Ktedonobacter racemifer]EFH79798.1 transport-associated protein [Ktedonobacter racemifer DSM 44963]